MRTVIYVPKEIDVDETDSRLCGNKCRYAEDSNCRCFGEQRKAVDYPRYFDYVPEDKVLTYFRLKQCYDGKRDMQ